MESVSDLPTPSDDAPSLPDTPAAPADVPSRLPADASTAPTDASPQPAEAPRPSRKTHLLREIVDTALLTAIIFLLVNTATSRFIIESVSMQPNLYEGEYVIVDKVSYALHSPERGDIVVIDLPTEEKDLIKRVIGLPGETVEVSNGTVYIDGRPIQEPYALPAPNANSGARKLGVDEYFVMGDNRNNSRDSRAFGPIRRDTIVGRAWVIYWPPADWSIIPHYAYAASGTH